MAGSHEQEPASPSGTTPEAGQDVARVVFGTHFESIKRYVDTLTSTGITRGLLGPREADRVWERHILNSVALEGLIPHGVTVMDVGSGAGLPGIPLAVARPDLTVILLEPLLRRATFLAEVVDDLGLGDRVEVRRGRAEDQDDVVDVVTCRAVATLDKLVRWCTPLFFPGGQLLALKGESAAEEVAAARALLARSDMVGEVLTVRAAPAAEPTFVIRVRHD